MLIDQQAHQPRVARTAYGHEFDPRAMRWKWRGQLVNVNLSFEYLSRRAPNLLQGAQVVLAWVAEQRGDRGLLNDHGRLMHFLKHCSPDEECVPVVSAAQVLNYHASPASSNGRLSAVAGLLRLWHDFEQPGVTPDAISLLQQMRLQGNAKGIAVRTMDPRSGPLTDLERESLFAALNDCYASGDLTLEAYLVSLLAAALAPRPVQLAGLKICDFSRSPRAAGPANALLMVPRAKQGDKLARCEFTERPLSRDIEAILQLQCEAVRSSHALYFDDFGQAPLFPAKTRYAEEPEGFEFHRTADSIGSLLTRTISKVKARSERTGECLTASAVRFRRTLGTNAAREGHGPLVIAALLDHTDTQNAGVYTETSVEFVENLDRAMAFQLAPIA